MSYKNWEIISYQLIGGIAMEMSNSFKGLVITNISLLQNKLARIFTQQKLLRRDNLHTIKPQRGMERRFQSHIVQVKLVLFLLHIRYLR
jgi:hypothetical protein